MSRAALPLNMPKKVKDNISRVEATLTQAQLVSEQVRKQLEMTSTHDRSAQPPASGGRGSDSRSSAAGTGGKMRTSAGTQAIACKALNGMSAEGTRLGAVRLLEAAMRKAANDPSWETHKPPVAGEGCPWVALFGKCTSTKCVRCAEGGARVDKKLVNQIIAAFRDAASTSEAAKATAAEFAPPT